MWEFSIQGDHPNHPNIDPALLIWMNKPLWKHIIEKHQGDAQGVPIFSHFSMKLTSVFVKPQRRKANERVRIDHFDPDTRMNSKDEYVQGTNIFIRVRFPRLATIL